MYGCVLCPCVKVFELGRKSQPALPCCYPYFLFQVVVGTAFAFFSEKTNWAYSKAVLGNKGVYMCVCILNDQGIGMEQTLKSFDWTNVTRKYFGLSGESTSQHTLESGIWVQEQKKKIPETLQMWLLELNYTLLPSLFSVVYLKKG